MSTRLILTLNMVSLYLGRLKLMVCQPGLAVHMGSVLPRRPHSSTWLRRLIDIYIENCHAGELAYKVT